MLMGIGLLLCAALGIYNAVHIFLYLMGAEVYDWNTSRKPKYILLDPPSFAVLIPAHNEAKNICRTLDSVAANNYTNYRIVVVDDASTDNTSAVVREYQRENPSVPLELIVLLENSGKGEALNTALRNLQDVELVMTLDADSQLPADALSNAAQHFADPAVQGLAANVKVLAGNSFLGLVQKMEHLVAYRSKKFYSAANCEFIVGGVASTYRLSTLREVGFYDCDVQTEDIRLSLKVVGLGNRTKRLQYAHDVVAYTEAVLTLRQLLRQRLRWKLGSLQCLYRSRHLILRPTQQYTNTLTLYRMPLALVGEVVLLLEPLCLLFVAYLAYRHGSLMPFLGAFCLLSAYMAASVISDEHMSLRQKLRGILVSPFMYFGMSIMTYVQFTAAVFCLVQWRRIVRHQGGPATWVSPQRHSALPDHVG